MKKLFAILIATIMMFSIVGCDLLENLNEQLEGKNNITKPERDDEKDDLNISEDENKDEPEKEKEDFDEFKEVQVDADPTSGLSSTQITKLNKGTGWNAKEEIVNIGKGGLIYSDESGKYGILSLDGTKDSGAKYASCEAIGKFFKVTFVDSKINVEDISTINKYGIVDSSGKEIVSAEYAMIEKISDRYFNLTKVTEQTKEKSEALIYFTSSMVSLAPGEDDVLFKGKWEVFDVERNKFVDGVGGTENNCDLRGEKGLLTCSKGYGNKIKINGKGEKLSESAIIISGYYTDNNAVYDDNGNKMFDYAPDGFIPDSYVDGYFISKKREDGKVKYVVTDLSGKILSNEFVEDGYYANVDVCGSVILFNEKAYDFSGNLIAEGTYNRLYKDEPFGGYCIAQSSKDNSFIIVQADGTLLYKETAGNVFVGELYARNGGDHIDGYNYYSFKDKDYTIKGSHIISRIFAQESANGCYNLIDSATNEILIKGYETYRGVVVGDVIYICAGNSNSSSIFVIK